MIGHNLFTHLQELNVIVRLKDDLSGLEFDAPKGVLTPELLELLREHKADLIEAVYEYEERLAIVEEAFEEEVEPAPRSMPYVLTFEGDKNLIADFKHHPTVTAIVAELIKYGGGVIEIVRDERRAA